MCLVRSSLFAAAPGLVPCLSVSLPDVVIAPALVPCPSASAVVCRCRRRRHLSLARQRPCLTSLLHRLLSLTPSFKTRIFALYLSGNWSRAPFPHWERLMKVSGTSSTIGCLPKFDFGCILNNLCERCWPCLGPRKLKFEHY